MALCELIWIFSDGTQAEAGFAEGEKKQRNCPHDHLTCDACFVIAGQGRLRI